MKSRRKYKAKMPTLPVEEMSRNSELLQKSNWNTGVITAKIAPPLRNFGSGLKNPHHKIIFILAFFAVLVVVLAGVAMFAGKMGTKPTGQAQQLNYDYPFEPNAVRIESEMQKAKFIENFQKANIERDSKVRYKLLEENFMALKGFYSATQSSEYREYLEKFKPFMEKNFPGEVKQKATIYNIACLDELCQEVKLPQEIVDLQKEIVANLTIGQNAKNDLARSFNAAAHAADKTEQGVIYLNALSALFSEYNRTHDRGTKASYDKLFGFLKGNYPEQSIPQSITIAE